MAVVAGFLAPSDAKPARSVDAGGRSDRILTFSIENIDNFLRTL
jgi:hypothetical protein